MHVSWEEIYWQFSSSAFCVCRLWENGDHMRHASSGLWLSQPAETHQSARGCLFLSISIVLALHGTKSNCVLSLNELAGEAVRWDGNRGMLIYPESGDLVIKDSIFPEVSVAWSHITTNWHEYRSHLHSWRQAASAWTRESGLVWD